MGQEEADNIESDAKRKVQDTISKLSITHERIDINPRFADTSQFCKEYGYNEEDSGNTIIVASKKEPKIFAACLVLATTKLDVNKKVKKLMGVSRLSFANAVETAEQTRMVIGGVTILGLPESMRIFVDSKIFERDLLVTGGGGRSTKIVLNPNEIKKIPNVEIIDNLSLPV